MFDFCSTDLRSRFALVAFFSCSLLLVPYLEAQAPPLNDINNQTQTPIPGVGHNYQHLLGETVNFSNGSLSFKISFPVQRGRGISLPFVWSYDSAAVNPLDTEDSHTPVWDYSANHAWPRKDGWNISEGLPTATVQVWTVNPPTGPGNPMIPCNYQSGMTFTDEEGVTHNLYTKASAPAFINLQDQQICGSFTQPPTGDGQVIATLDPVTGTQYLASDSPSSGDFSVMDKNGVTYQFPAGSSSQSPGVMLGANLITDRNGNQISLNAQANALVDTLGRSGPSLSGYPSPTATEPSTVIASVDNLTYQSTWNTTSLDFTVNVQGGPDPKSGTGVVCGPFPNVVSGTRNVLSSLLLPNNQTYSFYYGNNVAPNGTSTSNIYGLLNEVVFPDGGWISYAWQLPPASPTADSQFNMLSSTAGVAFTGLFVQDPQSFGCNWQYQTPVLASRKVSFDGKTVAQVQNFSFATTWQYNSDGSVNGWIKKTATVTTTDNLRGGLSAQTVYTYLPYYPASQPFATSASIVAIPLENTITYYDWGSSTPTKVVTKHWLDQFNLASEMTAVYQTGGPPRVSETIYRYQNYLCNNIQLTFFPSTNPLLQINTNPVGSLVYLTEQDDFDFGNGNPGPLVKKTLYNYNCFQPPFPSLPAPVSTIPPEVSSVTVEDGNGIIKAATQYGFDAPPVSPLSASPVQHSPNFGSTGSSTGPSVRGNVTSITKCNPLPTSPTAACSGSTTNFAFDVTGQPVSMTDPNNNTTTFSFADAFTDDSSAPSTNAYLTQITYPPINGVSLQKKFNYSYWLGYLTYSIDENSQSTHYIYNSPNATACSGTDGPSADGATDGMDRLSEVDSPDGGQTFYCYNDAALTSTKKVLLNSTPQYIANVALTDRMGHTTETYLTSDPDGMTTVDTTYDGEGKVYTISNPYRGAGPSSIVTKHYYDALGRTVETIEPDGNILQSCYNGIGSTIAMIQCNKQLGSVASASRPGTWTDSTDERGNSWQRTSDVFGNLIEAMEPNGTSPTPTMETDYTYDTLNNLTAVAQYGGANGSAGVRARTFSYDSLSRLVSAYNPETGTISYTYDLDSNVLTKTDGRSLTTHYGYDALNRLLSKTYTLGTSGADPTGTPSACYQYGNSIDTNNFTGGRLINAWTQTSQTCPNSPASYITLRAIKAGPGGQPAYDPMGRLKNEQQSTPANQGVYSPQYFYDLAGELISSTDGITPSPTTPGTPLTFKTTYANSTGGAGRVMTVSSNWNDSTHPSPLFSPQATAQTPNCPNSMTGQYAAFGGLTNAAFGAGLMLNRTYDVRLRTSCELDIGTGATAATPGSATVTITGAEQSN